MSVISWLDALRDLLAECEDDVEFRRSVRADGDGASDLVERLTERGSDSPEQIERRLAAAREELAARDEFDHHVVNDDLDRAVEELAQLAATMCPP